MTRESSSDGVPPPEAAAYYARRAAGGVGLIITEGIAIPHPVAHYNKQIPHIYGAAALARWRDVINAVHAAGGKIVSQLWHAGLERRTANTANPSVPSIAPSLVPGVEARAMTSADIEAVVEAFATAAQHARDIGFDAIELHGAHGYLLDTFFWPVMNRRSDDYGGSIEKRNRLAKEVIGAVRKAVGTSFPVILRVSQWKTRDYDAQNAATPADLERWIRPLSDGGIDIIHVSTRRFWAPAFAGSASTLAGWVKKVSGLPVIIVGSVGAEDPFSSRGSGDAQSLPGAARNNIALLVELFRQGQFDLVAVGRMLLANPTFADMLRRDDLSDLAAFDAVRDKTGH